MCNWPIKYVDWSKLKACNQGLLCYPLVPKLVLTTKQFDKEYYAHNYEESPIEGDEETERETSISNEISVNRKQSISGRQLRLWIPALQVAFGDGSLEIVWPEPKMSINKSIVELYNGGLNHQVNKTEEVDCLG